MRILSIAYTIVFSVLLFSCSGTSTGSDSTPASREEYLSDFRQFVLNVKENYRDYSKKDWSRKDSVYQLYTGKYYDKFSNKLTSKQEEKIGSYKAIYSKAKAGKLYEHLKNKAEQFKGALKSLKQDM